MSSDETNISVSNDVGGVADSASKSAQRMSESQAVQLKRLASEQGVPVDLDLSADDAAKKIQELEKKPRGSGTPQP